MILVGISGKRGTGKSTLGNILQSHYGFKHLGFAQELKRRIQRDFPLTHEDTDGSRKELGNPLIGGFTPRELMIEYGNFFRKFDANYWVDACLEDALRSPKVVVSDVRYSNEADRIRDLGGIVVRLERPAELNIYKGVITNASETELDDYELFNLRLPAEKNVSLEDLFTFARDIVNLEVVR
jgi:hypothetical protein